uniref:Uncharacterized protein n=1 Tax=Mycena chlorophos TaxID=658473 RepID=A0ABQ0LJY6_MYCCL|nr:predicted protein [Mycena chlorophos]
MPPDSTQPAGGNGHGGARPGAGRPPGSKNKKTVLAAGVGQVRMVSAPRPPPARSDPIAPEPEPVAGQKRTAAGRLTSTMRATVRGVANFFSTRAPQGTHAMAVKEDSGNTAPEPHNSVRATIAALQDEMQTVDTERIADRVLDESLESGGEGEEDAEELNDGETGDDDEAELDAEQAEAETAKNSVNDDWLAATLTQIKQQIFRFKQPFAYRDGHLWIYPKDPIFALQDAASLGFTANALYQLPIFLWIPDFLPGHPDCFYCECGQVLNKHKPSGEQIL